MLHARQQEEQETNQGSMLSYKIVIVGTFFLIVITIGTSAYFSRTNHIIQSSLFLPSESSHPQKLGKVIRESDPRKLSQEIGFNVLLPKSLPKGFDLTNYGGNAQLGTFSFTVTGPNSGKIWSV